MSGRAVRTALATTLTITLLAVVPASATVTFTTVNVATGSDRRSHNPEIDGAWIVWEEGVESDPGAKQDIWAKNLRTGVTGAILTGTPAIDDKEQRKPDVSMERLVFEHWTSDTNCDIGGTDLRTGVSAALVYTADREIKPRISGDLLIWLNDTTKELYYANVRTWSVDDSISETFGFTDWDVDRGRIVYATGAPDESTPARVRTFRPGFDDYPTDCLVCAPTESVARVRLHGDMLAVQVHANTYSALIVHDIRSGETVTRTFLGNPGYGVHDATPFHRSVAFTYGMLAGMDWWEDPLSGGEATVHVHGEDDDQAFDPSMFGRHIAFTHVLPDTAELDISLAVGPPEAHRSAGVDRYATAADASAAYFSAADTAILCTGLNFPDALAAAPLARVLDAPLLLARTDSLPAATTAELQRLGVDHVCIVGGTSALSTQIENELASLDISHDRIAGADRYETANEIAERVVAAAMAAGGYSGTAFFARGDAFPDALAVGPVAAQAVAPIFLVRSATVPDSVETALGVLNVRRGYVIGGETAIDSSAQTVIDAALTANGGTDTPTTRWSGENRYETAVAVVNGGLTQRWIDLDTLGVATGADFPDALGGGAALGCYGSGLVLTPGDSVHPAVAAFMVAHQYEIGRLDVFGGTAVISETVKGQFASMIK